MECVGEMVKNETDSTPANSLFLLFGVVVGGGNAVDAATCSSCSNSSLLLIVRCVPPLTGRIVGGVKVARGVLLLGNKH